MVNIWFVFCWPPSTFFVLWCVSYNSLSHGLSIFQESRRSGEDTLKLEANVESGKVFLVFTTDL